MCRALYLSAVFFGCDRYRLVHSIALSIRQFMYVHRVDLEKGEETHAKRRRRYLEFCFFFFFVRFTKRLDYAFEGL